MTCTFMKDKLTKDFVDREVLNVSTNKILKPETFKRLNEKYAQHFQKTFRLDNMTLPFKMEGEIAMPNEEFLNQLDEFSNPSLAQERQLQSDLDEIVDVEEENKKPLSTRLLKIASSHMTEKAHQKFFNKLSDVEQISAKLKEATRDSIATTEDKIQRMQEVFDTDVIVDTELQASGALLAADHPLSKKAGKPVIVINPDKMFSDTVFHEFGHLYVDLLGGLKDPKVAQAVELLKGSTLWNDVQQAYPDLQGENLAKEVLATALGVKGNDIYNGDTQKESVWQQIKTALLSVINKLLGSSYGTNAIEDIASEMLSGNVRVNSTRNFNTRIDQLSKLFIENPTPENIDKHFSHLTERFKLDEETHEYNDSENDKVLKHSVSSFAKSLIYRPYNTNRKGRFDIRFDESQELNEKNIEMRLTEGTLPMALDNAFQRYFKGYLPETSLTFTNSDPDKYWYTFYTEHFAESGGIVNSREELFNQIRKDLKQINAAAYKYQEENDKPAAMGNVIHKALEEYVQSNGEIAFPKNIKGDANKELIKTIKGIVDKGKANGSRFYTEQVLFSEAAQKPGTADLIEITKDGTFRIYDFKTTKSFTDKMGEPKTDYAMYIGPGYMHQLMIYSTILEEYNLKPADNHLNIISIEVDGEEFNAADPENSTVKVTGVINRNINPSDKKFINWYKTAKRRITSEFRNPQKLGEFEIETKEKRLETLTKKIERGIHDYRELTHYRTGKFKGGALTGVNSKIKVLEEDIEKAIGKNNSLVLYKYIQNMRDSLDIVYEAMTDGEAMLSAEYLNNIQYLLQASSFIPDVQTFLDTTDDSFAIEGKDKIELMQLLNETNRVVEQVKDRHENKIKEMAIFTLAENSNIMEGYWAEKFELRAINQEKLTKKEDIDQYIEENIRKNKEIIEQSEYEYWRNLIQNGYTDLRHLEYLIADPGMNKSQFVQVVKNMLDKMDNSVRIDLDRSIPDIVKWHDELKIKKTGDPKKIWGKFLETAKYKDIDGKEHSYTHASVIPEKTSEKREIIVRYNYELEYINREIDNAFKKNQTQKIEKFKKHRKEVLEKRGKELKNASTELHVHPAYAKLNDQEKEALKFIHNKLEEADLRLSSEPSKQLVRGVGQDYGKIYNLPKMRKNIIEASHNLKSSWKEFSSSVKDMWRPPADEDELNTTNQERNAYEENQTKNTDILGNPSYDIPVFYRNPLEDPELQSFDIPTLLSMNEETTIAFEHRKAIEADLFMVTNAIKSSEALKTDSIIAKNVTDKVSDKLSKALKSSDNLTLKAVQASIDNRFYKRAYQGTYSKWKYRGIKAGEALSKGTSALLLGGNFRSAAMTATQGFIYRLVEGKANEHFNMEDVKKGSAKAMKDIGQMIKDTQEQFPKSKTNLLIRRFGLETQYKSLVNKFVQNNFASKNLDQASMYAITSIAETMVTANLMYTLLGNIKVMNNDGDYINAQGKPVDKKDAMSLDEAYTVEDGKLVLNSHVAYTDRNLTHKFRDSYEGEKTTASTEISRYIRSVYADLYGQYNSDMKSVAEMNIIGKMVFSMRKWLPRGAHRRWRGITSARAYTLDEARDISRISDRFYSQDQKKFQEGFYTTGVRFAHSIVQKMQDDKISLMSMSNAWKTGKEIYNTSMTRHEQANLKRLLSETAILALTSAIAMVMTMIVRNMDDEDEERNDVVYFGLYLLERIQMESATFLNPFEIVDMIQNPAAAMNTMTRLQRLFKQLTDVTYDENGDMDFSFNDQYERGLREGQYKLKKHLLQLLPWYKNTEQFLGILGFNSNETIEDSYEYLIR